MVNIHLQLEANRSQVCPTPSHVDTTFSSIPVTLFEQGTENVFNCFLGFIKQPRG